MGALAARGSVLQIFGTGYDPLDGFGQAVAGVWIADIPAAVLYGGPAPSIPALWQINVQVPNESVVAGEVPAFVGALGMVSNGVTIWVQP
jgi:uncharacterized protein (TIGR03437 family)